MKNHKKRKNKKRKKFLYIAFSPSLKNGIKIGFTYNLKERLKSLSSSVPEAYLYLSLLELSKNMSDKDFLNQLEKKYHCRFIKIDECLYFSEFVNTNKISISSLISEFKIFAKDKKITETLYINEFMVNLLCNAEV